MDSAEFADWWNALPRASCERSVGVRLLDCDRARSWVSLAFEAPAEFLNARGTVQGGFAAAMLDTCLGIPVLLASDGRMGPITLNLSVDFLAPIPAGALRGEGQVTKMGRRTAFVTSSLFDPSGATVAQARQVAQLFERPAD